MAGEPLKFTLLWRSHLYRLFFQEDLNKYGEENEIGNVKEEQSEAGIQLVYGWCW